MRVDQWYGVLAGGEAAGGGVGLDAGALGVTGLAGVATGPCSRAPDLREPGQPIEAGHRSGPRRLEQGGQAAVAARGER